MIIAVSLNILAFACISHPGEIMCVSSYHSVLEHPGADVKDVRWLGCSVTLSLQSNGVCSCDTVC